MSGSALGAIVSSDPLWNINGLKEEEEDEEPELPQLYFHYVGETKVKSEVKQGEIREEDKYRVMDDKENHKSHERNTSTTSALGIGRPRGVARTYSDVSDTHTPPQVSGFSTHSSASSARIGSLTDASTVSHSSMEPTPPSAYGSGREHISRTSLSSIGSGGGSGSGGSGSGSGDRPLGRTYGGSSSRTFQRHVSAPLGRNWPAREDKSRETVDVSPCE